MGMNGVNRHTLWPPMNGHGVDPTTPQPILRVQIIGAAYPVVMDLPGNELVTYAKWAARLIRDDPRHPDNELKQRVSVLTKLDQLTQNIRLVHYDQENAHLVAAIE